MELKKTSQETELQQGIEYAESSVSPYRQTNFIAGKAAKLLHTAASQILLPLMTLVITLEVLFRYFLGAGFTWSQEVCGLCFLLLVFLCQAHTWQENHHIRMDIFYNYFNTTLKRFSDVLTIICGLILYIAIIWQGVSDFEYQFMVNESTEELMWPLWPFSLVMIISSAVAVILLIRFFATMLLSKKN